MDFICLDVETANESAASICQIGIATFIDDEHRPDLDIEAYIDPEDYFLGDLIDIHGISERDVAGARTYPQVHKILSQHYSGRPVLCHSHFDRVSMEQASAKYGLASLDFKWLDTLRVARRAWPNRVGNGGHGLRPLADYCGIRFKHHSALQDAWCAGKIFLQACSVAGLTLDEWFVRVNEPVVQLFIAYPSGNPDGHLFGEVIVFTGQLSKPRGEMADIASFAGCRVDEGVTKHTTLVVVGDQDVRRLNGKSISSKHQKARELIANGKPLRVISEADLMLLIAR